MPVGDSLRCACACGCSRGLRATLTSSPGGVGSRSYATPLCTTPPVAAAAAATGGSGGGSGGGPPPGREHLPHLAVDDPLLESPLRVARDHASPEAHRAGITQVLDDLPASGEAVEDQACGSLADPSASAGPGHEELGHAIARAGRCRARTPHH